MTAPLNHRHRTSRFGRIWARIDAWLDPKCGDCGQPLTWIGGPWYCLFCPGRREDST